MSDKVFTLVDLANHVSQAYLGTKDAKQSESRLRTAIDLLGPPSQPVSTIGTLDIDRVIAELRKQGLNPKTINRYLAALSKAFRWAMDREIIPKKPKITMLPESQGRLAWLTEDQETMVCQWLKANGYQDVSLVTKVLISTGFRVNELLSRRLDHLIEADGGYWLHLDHGETKNNGARAGWLPGPLGRSLAAMMTSGLPHYRRLLQGLSRASLACARHDPSMPHVTPHVLRHTTATRLTQASTPTAVVKEYLGHRSLATTLKYTHVQKDELKQAASKLQVTRRTADTNRNMGQTVETEDGWRPRPESNRGARICSPQSVSRKLSDSNTK